MAHQNRRFRDAADTKLPDFLGTLHAIRGRRESGRSRSGKKCRMIYVNSQPACEERTTTEP